MSRQAILSHLVGITLVACGHRPPPATVADLSREPDCQGETGQRDSGIALDRDIYRGPRYRVDSAGRVETLPPVPAVSGDSLRPGCTALRDTSSGSGR
jgi:hypothetical protein